MRDLHTLINGLKRMSQLKGTLPENDRELLADAAIKLEEIKREEDDTVSNIAGLLKPGQTYGEYLNEQFREMGCPFVPFPEAEKGKQNR